MLPPIESFRNGMSKYAGYSLKDLRAFINTASREFRNTKRVFRNTGKYARKAWNKGRSYLYGLKPGSEPDWSIYETKAPPPPRGRTRNRASIYPHKRSSAPTRSPAFDRYNVQGPRRRRRYKSYRRRPNRSRTPSRTPSRKRRKYPTKKPTSTMVRSRRFKRRSGRRRRKSHRRRRRKNVNQYRTIYTDILKSSENSVQYTYIDLAHTTHLETCASRCTTVGQNDANDTTRLETLDLTTDAIPGAKIRVHSASMRLTFRNNQDIDARVTFYSLLNKTKTVNSLATTFTNGMTDRGITGAATDPRWYLTDSPEIHRYWKFVKKWTVLLRPGMEYIFSIKVPHAFTYNPDELDNDASIYKQRITRVCAIRCQGVVAHDSVSEETQIGLAGAQIDYSIEHFYKYNAIVNKNHPYNYSGNSYDAFTNQPEQVQRNIEDTHTA